MKIKLVIADHDEYYAKGLLNYFNIYYHERLEVSMFTNAKSLNQYLLKNNVDMILAVKGFGIDHENIAEQTIFVYLVEHESDKDKLGTKAVCKYQRMEQIYKEILQIYSEENEHASLMTRKTNVEKIYTFVSCNGGAGSSTIAAAAAIDFARKEQRTLYLNLEKFGATSNFFTAPGNVNLEDVFFSIKGKKNVSIKLESAVKRDSSNVLFYDQCPVAFDLYEIDLLEIGDLLREIRSVGLFDIIIMDINIDFDKKSLFLLDISDRILFVSDETEVALTKQKRIFESFEVIEKQQNINIISKALLIKNKQSENTNLTNHSFLKTIAVIGRLDYESNRQLVEKIARQDILVNSITDHA